MLSRIILLWVLATSGVQGREGNNGDNGRAIFDPRRDGFRFANETVLAYGVDEEGRLHMGRREEPVKFAHHCFSMVRAALQMKQFARFEPKAPRISREETRRRLRAVFRIHAWSRGPRTPIIFPGYRNLDEFSAAQTRLIQEEIGAWLPTYLRVGNWRMAWPLNRLVQGRAARWIGSRLESGKLAAVYLTKFPSMNHAVLVYSATAEPSGDILFRAYDPNYPRKVAHLRYVAKLRGFEFEKRFYFPGGEVRALPIYRSPFH